MPLTKEKKQEIVKNLEEKIKNQKVAIFVNFKGLNMFDFSEIRESLRDKDSSIMVVKKSLMNIALKNNKIDIESDYLKDDIAIVFGFKDQINPAKTIHQFSRKNSKLKIVAGILDGKIKTREEMIELAILPSRDELISKTINTINAPLYGFVNVLEGSIRNLIYVLKQAKL
jgi:large subunit ribosomal protein L10